MNKVYKKTAPNTAQAQIEFHIEDFDAPAIGNAKTALIISAIIYILSNYTSKDNPRSVIDIHKIISGALGSYDATSVNTVRRFVNTDNTGSLPLRRMERISSPMCRTSRK